MSLAAQLRIVSVAPGPKRRTFLLQLNRPLTTGEAAELNVRGENPDFSGLGEETTLSVASEDNSILVAGEMSGDRLEAQMPELEEFLALIEQQGHELDEFEENKAEQARAKAAEQARKAESEHDQAALGRINQRLQNRPS